MSRNFVIKSYLIWRILLIVFVLISPHLLALQKNFLGGGLSNYLSNPLFWSASNYDGEHYVSIAASGYKPLQYFFFPVYPYLMKALSITDSTLGLVRAGHLISNISLLAAMFGLWKLVRLDFTEKVTKNTLLLLLLFPTSFFFASVYTESLFLACVVWSFYFARKNNWLAAGLLSGVASGVRVIGLLMLPVLFVEWYLQAAKSRQMKQLVLVAIAVLGLVFYMYFLYQTKGNPLAFKEDLEWVYGEQRSDRLISLPQVFYRYLFKILPAMNWSYFPGSFTLLLEFVTAVVFFLLSIVGYFKLRLSYWLYLVGGYIIPTFAGSFSSLPRYVVVLFPAFILLAGYYEKLPKVGKILTVSLLTSVLAISTALFSRGYWVS